MKTYRLAGALALACLVAAPPGAAAQETVNAASVSGRVVDPQNAVVSGASVSARQLDTNVIVETVTDRNGRFRFPYLKVGRYAITVSVQGFEDATRMVTLGVGSAFDLPIALALRGVDTSVTVTGAATVLEAARTQIAGTLAQAEVRTLPMNGRNFLDLALLVPGVSPTNTGSTQLFAETSAVPGQGLSVSSQRNLSNSFIVDGLSANDDAAGLSGVPYGVDAIEQFQVVTAGGQAEFGRAIGGYVNVVTKSGTNTVRGDVYEYLRDDSLNAANALTGSVLPMHQNQYGASVGGPVRHDQTFYFANVEQRRLDQSGLTTIAPANVAAINAKLAAVGYPGSPIETGIYPNPVDSTNVVAKLDHSISGGDQFGVRYTRYRVTSSNSRGAGALSAPSASAGLDDVDHAVAVSNVASLSARTVNETRAQFVYSDLKAPPTDPVGPAVSISGVASFGTLSGSPTRRRTRMYEIVDNLSHQAGAHALRAGVDFLYNDVTIAFPRASRGSYSFSSLTNFLAGTYNTAGFSQTFGETVVSQTNPNVGVYVQDEWRAAPGLTINAGLRYDLQFLETINTDTGNVAPRAGFAWSPTESHRTLVRGSVGLFYDRVPLRALANALLSAGNTTDQKNLQQIGISLSPAQAGAPVFPNLLAAPVPSVTLPNLSTMDPQMQNARSRQASLELEQQLGARSTVSVGYEYLHGENLIANINQNVPSCVASGTNNGCRPVSGVGNISQYSSVASSTYHGLHLSWVQRPGRRGFYRVSYTLSKAMDDVGQFFFSSPIDPTDITRDWGRSDNDQRHRLVVNAAVNSPMEPARTAWEHLTHGFQLSALLQYYSSLPLNITSGVTSLQGTSGRPLIAGPTPTPLDVRTVAFIPRNAGVGPNFLNVSLRGSRTFRIGPRLQLEGLLEVFNLTNRKNVVTMNGNFGTGAYPANPSRTFGQITSVGDPRSVQFGFRARF